MTNRRTGSAAQRFGGLAAILATTALIAACSSQAGGATNPPATNPAATTAAGGGLTIAVATDPTLGAYVTGKNGMSLYVYAKDTTPGTSACVGDCAGSWPPLTVASAADVTAGSGVTGAIGTITRADGTIQVTLAGAPLYYFAGDSAAGDVKGQGKGGVWSLASPAGTPVAGAATTPAAASPAASKCTSYCY